MINYTNEILDAYSNQINCEAGIYLDDTIIGVVQYVLYDRELTVSDIFIRHEYRRMGYGSKLMKYIKEINPTYKYIPSMKTTDGSKFVHKDISLTEKYNAKFVYESLNDILKPKSKFAILKDIKKSFNLDLLNKELKELPLFKHFLETFVYERQVYKPDIIENRFSSDYPIIDDTENGKTIILEVANKLHGELKVNQISGFAQHSPLTKLMFHYNQLNSNKIQHFKAFKLNNPFEWVYIGDDYGFVGSSKGFFIFIIPDDFIDNLMNA